MMGVCRSSSSFPVSPGAASLGVPVPRCVPVPAPRAGPLGALGRCRSGFSESSRCPSGSACVVQGGVCSEVAPGIGSVERARRRTLFRCSPPARDSLAPGGSERWLRADRLFLCAAFPVQVGMGTDVQARSVFSVSSVWVFLSFLLEGGIPTYIRRARALELRLRSYLHPVLKLDVLLKYVSKSNTSYWFNACLVVRSNEAEPAARAEPGPALFRSSSGPAVLP